MTRAEFFERVDDIYTLCSFCSDEGIDFCDNVYDYDYIDDWLNECLVDWARYDSWYELYERLSEYADMDHDAYYIEDEYHGGFREVNDYDYDDIRTRVIEYMDENGLWDDSVDDEEDEVDVTPHPQWESSCTDEADYDDEIPDEDCSVYDMFSAGVGCIKSIREEAVEKARQEDKAFAEFMF